MTYISYIIYHISIYLYIYLYHIYIYIYLYHISSFPNKDYLVELRTPAMPFGLEAFVAVKLRSLCWQHRFEQGWYCREAEGPEQQR